MSPNNLISIYFIISACIARVSGLFNASFIYLFFSLFPAAYFHICLPLIGTTSLPLVTSVGVCSFVPKYSPFLFRIAIIGSNVVGERVDSIVK